jgi:allophanate hydrolase
MPRGVRIGVPLGGQCIYFGDVQAARAYDDALTRLSSLGATIIEIDVEPFYETARLLYEGPWLAERFLTIRPMLASSPDAIHPITRAIIQEGARPSAADAFTAFYRLEELRRARDHVFQAIEALVFPTMPTVYTVDQVLADPVQLNSRLGTYTNFVNLLDLCGLAVPASMRSDGAPSGITLLAPAGRDGALATIGRAFHADTGLPLGATKRAQPPFTAVASTLQADEIALAVVGAHLSGMPLNSELRALGARLIADTSTSADYRLFALAGTVPPKPGMLRVADGEGATIAVEVWALTAEAFGRFVAAVPPPLSIGTVRLADGTTAKGFLVEATAIEGARDITSFGGWRAFVAAQG